ncbi:glycosyltransferase involved in cell wall biosynthesis [Pedobacter sp. UYP24]
MKLAKSIRKIFRSKKKAYSDFLSNLYNTSYGKKVLISYITHPFIDENNFTHQNHLTSHIVAEVFSELGYDVDVVDYQANTSVAYDSYAIIFGMGINYEKSFYSRDRAIPRIHFITGTHEHFHSAWALKSVRDFFKLTGVWLPRESKGITTSNYYACFDSDFSIILAGGLVYEDFKSRYVNKLYSLNNNILGAFSNFKPKQIEDRNKNFLYLSGTGQVQKGLFLVLETARIRKDVNFYIVVFHVDALIEEYYHEFLTSAPNVFLSLNLRMDSIEIKTIVENCTYSIAPSYVDGFPGGTIEPMSAGLVPIVSRNCGFPSEDFIIEISDLTVEGVGKAIDWALALEDNVYLNYSLAAKAYIHEGFSVSSVKKEFTKILETELKNGHLG